MATTSDIKNGAVILYKNKRMKVVEFLHVKPGKGPAFVRTKLKDISSGKIIDETFNSGIKLEFLKIEAKEMQFLYDDGDSHIFMDNVTYEQINVINSLVGNIKNFLKGGINVDLLFDDTEVLDIRLPAHVALEVKHTEPGVKGNTATGATKPATLETNYTLNVPLFVDEGDILKIDTRSGEYIERVKS
ncbi:MAG: elongation factor P [Candidatus Marinimicrobia bacterium]|jgi:elongation factor P|nr:elongation factor P [Candidatus Neomarinimicrobiota bacterium]MDG2366773.1 elongation factor P [Candidatus Neomarinimicrobiota bacterium]|tara:strand:- start:1939 stop:2502 length:564 start_codon:yes stop_codon:yes gene_type:complete